MCAAVPNTRQDSGLKVPSLRKCPSRPQMMAMSYKSGIATWQSGKSYGFRVRRLGGRWCPDSFQNDPGNSSYFDVDWITEWRGVSA